MGSYTNNKQAIDKLYDESLSEHIDKQELHDRIKLIADNFDNEVSKLNIKQQSRYWKQSNFRRIFQVHERLLLVRYLKKHKDESNLIFLNNMYPGLCTYLLLTCFDQLGQPFKGWVFFPDWLRSKSRANEVENAIRKIKKYEPTNQNGKINLDYVGELYNEYHEIYGVKNSFYRFLRNVLPSKQRNNLLNKILIEHHIEIDGKYELNDWGTDLEKEKWLYRTRNDYTHNLYSVQKFYTAGKISFDEELEQREIVYHSDYVEVVWVKETFDLELDKTIIIGILETIKSSSQEYNNK